MRIGDDSRGIKLAFLSPVTDCDSPHVQKDILY